MAGTVEGRIQIVIVGAGPGGLAAGAQAAARGVSHVLLERSDLASTIVKYQKGKHVMDEPPALSLRQEVGIPFKAGSREAVLDGFAEGTKHSGTNLKIGAGYEVTKIEGKKGDFRVSLRNGETLVADNIVLGIGLQGNLRTFGVPGDDLSHVTYQLDDPAAHVDKDVVVIGTGDAGIENAIALAEKNEVSIVNRSDEFSRAKPGNRALIDAAIKGGKIRHYSHSTVQRIEENGIWLETPDGALRVKADLIIGRLGADPPRSFLEAIGIEFPSKDRGAVPRVSETYETNVPGVYLVGAIAGYPLIKHCINQGYEVVEYILGNYVEPADEPLLRKKFEGMPGTVSEILTRIQATLPVFSGLTNIQLREFLVSSEVHLPKAGDVVFRQNDFSDSFYSIIDGGVDVVVADPQGKESRFSLSKGQYFGEMSLVSGRRRSGTVIARDKCVLIETPRLSMNALIRSVPAVKRIIDETFILRTLQISMGSSMSLEELQALAKTAVIETYKQGAPLFNEGDEANGLHFIRRGSVAVSRRVGGREQILAYLPAGNIIGEMALLSPQAKRSASVKANVLTETIRVPQEAIIDAIRRNASLRSMLQEMEGKRAVENVARSADRRASDIVSFLMESGAGEATDLLLIDEALCVRCNNCETACKETHGGVSRLDREAGPTFGTVHIPTSCRHCENPKCMTDCPPDAIHRNPTGEVFIQDNCIGCGNCASNCPYSVIQMAEVHADYGTMLIPRILFGERPPRVPKEGEVPHKHATKCDLCKDLPGSGPGRTACVASCPTGAILRVNPKAYVDRVGDGGAEVAAAPGGRASVHESYLKFGNYRYLKLSLLVLLLSTLAVLFLSPTSGASGGTVVGYTLGTLSAAIMLWLMALGARKRRYRARGRMLREWVSAHVYFGLLLIFLVPLHSGLQFGWNVHTMAYAITLLVIASGIMGLILYGTVPKTMSEEQSGEKLTALIEQVANFDAECKTVADGLPDRFAQAVLLSINETRIGGGLRAQFGHAGGTRGVAKALESVRAALGEVDDTLHDPVQKLVGLLAHKRQLVDRIRRRIRFKALLDFWLVAHVPLAFASIAAVAVHVFVVLYYR